MQHILHLQFVIAIHGDVIGNRETFHVTVQGQHQWSFHPLYFTRNTQVGKLSLQQIWF